MFGIFKESIALLNKNLKEVIKLFVIIIFGTIIGSTIFPIGGYALSIGIFIYATQIIMRFVKDEYLNIEEIEEPCYSGIIKSYIYKVILGIPVIISFIIASAFLLKGFISLSFSSIYFSGFEEGFKKLFLVIAISFGIILFSTIITQLISPFYQFVLLDDDFKDNSFFKNLKISFRLAHGYRFKVLLVLMLSCISVVISLFTFGLALIYFYPLQIVILSKLYFESKRIKNV